MEMKCSNCGWWREEDSAIKDLGGCHRHAPYLVPNYDKGAWPIVESNYGCGDYREKE